MLDGMSVSTAVRDQMPNDHVAAVVLAAGKGTRMKSILPKVLHPLAGRPMILHLLDTVHTVGVERAVVVVGPEGENVAEAVAPALTAVQEEALGTGHAVMSARAALRSEEHTSELQSLMRSSYAVFCLKKKNNSKSNTHHQHRRH